MSVHCFSLFCLMAVVLAPVQAAKPRSLAPPATSAADSRSRLFVLAIGINAYPGKNRLTYAVKDARNIAQILRAKGRRLHRQVEVKLLVDREADRQGILDGMVWLQREVTPRDMAVIFYSGHGDRHPEVGFFLVPARYRDARPLQTMVSGAELKDAARQLRGPAIVLLDCCHAGAILNDRPTPLPQSAVGTDLSEVSPRLAFLCASRAREESEENDAARNGIFTRLLVKALSGRADLNGDGVVSLGEVERFLKRRLPRASKGQQHPVTASAGLPTISLVRP